MAKFVWQMIKEAVEQSGKEVVTNADIKNYILKNYGEKNSNTINSQILSACVNKDSRIYYPENSKPRKCIGQNDFLYSVGRGQVALYNPEKHGEWELAKGEDDRLIVCRIGEDIQQLDLENLEETTSSDIRNTFTFALESQLRDFLVQNLNIIDHTLSIYVSDDDISGVEYRTGVGNIDILAVDNKNNFVVIELKVSKGADAVLGQIQRYMGWVKKNMAKSKSVRGIIITKSVSDRLKYAVSVTENISLFEYEVTFAIKEPQSIL